MGVGRFVDEPSVSWFDIGRSVNPADACSRKGCDAYQLLYQTMSLENAMQVEEALRSAFVRHPKFVGRSADARGGTPWGPATNYVYIVYGLAG